MISPGWQVQAQRPSSQIGSSLKPAVAVQTCGKKSDA